MVTSPNGKCEACISALILSAKLKPSFSSPPSSARRASSALLALRREGSASQGGAMGKRQQGSGLGALYLSQRSHHPQRHQGCCMPTTTKKRLPLHATHLAILSPRRARLSSCRAARISSSMSYALVRSSRTSGSSRLPRRRLHSTAVGSHPAAGRSVSGHLVLAGSHLSWAVSKAGNGRW